MGTITESIKLSGLMERPKAHNKIVILGLGNVLMGDDGAGVHTVERLRANDSVPNVSEPKVSEPNLSLPADVSLIDGGTLSFSLLELVESTSALIIVDAMELDAPAGTLKTFIDDELDQFLAAPTQRNIHDVNLGDLLRMCALLGTLPLHRVLVGIQPQLIAWQERPSDVVSEGIDRACQTIYELVGEWTYGNG